TIGGIPLNASFNVAVFSYSGSGNTIAYNRAPPKTSFTIPPNQVIAQVDVESPDVIITFSANPGEWYWLQTSDELTPPNWQSLGTAPVLANNIGMVIVHVNGALANHRYYRLQQMDPSYKAKYSAAGITSLQRSGDSFPTEYIAGGSRLGDAN